VGGYGPVAGSGVIARSGAWKRTSGFAACPAERRRTGRPRLQERPARADAVHVSRIRTNLPSATLPLTAAGTVRVAAVVVSALVVAAISTTALVMLDSTGAAAGGAGMLGATGTVAVAAVCVLVAFLIALVYMAVTGQERAAAREALLARNSRTLLGVTDPDEVRAATGETAAALVAATPGLGLMFLRREGGHAVVESAYGLPRVTAGDLLPIGALARLDPDEVGAMRRLEGDTDDIDALVTERRRWRGCGVGSPDAERFALVGAGRWTPGDAYDAVRTLVTQLAIAEAGCTTQLAPTHATATDELAGLPGRAVFFHRVTSSLSAAAGHEATVALMIVDIDDFKLVNDSLGQAVGDELLSEVAGRIVEIAAEHDGIAARFGGDEFAVLVTGLDGRADAARVAERLCDDLRRPVQTSMGGTAISASIGLAVAGPGLTPADLIRCADIAMYSAKARGKNRVEEYTEERYGGIAQVRVLEEHLAKAVGGREIAVHYQPMVDLKTGRCVGMEALARWQHPTLGLLKPASFIPLAERGGYAVELGASVLQAACRQTMAWSELPGGDGLRIAVNVAGGQLVEPGFVQTVVDQLIDSGLPASRLTLELTESEVLYDETAQAQMAALAEMGVRIALDDFGAGFASLANLHAVPVYQLKIDRGLLVRRDQDRADAMVNVIMSVSEYLGLETVAEQVETVEHAEWARRIGIRLAHGHLFAPPMPAEEFAGWLTRSHQGAGMIIGTPTMAALGSPDASA
jgi:diguanylate cyclase (GGDEF)-like protein